MAVQWCRTHSHYFDAQPGAGCGKTRPATESRRKQPAYVPLRGVNAAWAEFSDEAAKALPLDSLRAKPSKKPQPAKMRPEIAALIERSK